MSDLPASKIEQIEDQTEGVIEYILGRQLTVNELTLLHHVISLVMLLFMVAMSMYMVVR